MPPLLPARAPTLAPKLAPYDLDAVDDVAGTILVNAREVAVHHADGLTYRALRELEEAGATDVRVYYDCVVRLCPQLPLGEIERLSAPKVGRIIAIATGMIQRVEAEEAERPNADGPVAETSAPTPAGASPLEPTR